MLGLTRCFSRRRWGMEDIPNGGEQEVPPLPQEHPGPDKGIPQTVGREGDREY